MEKILRFLFPNPVMLWFYLGYVLMLVVFPFHSANELNHITILQLRADYILHALLFLPWAFFRPAFGIKPGWCLLNGLAFAAGSEGLQYLLPYRSWYINDLVANVLGVVFGFGICMFFRAFRKQPKTLNVD